MKTIFLILVVFGIVQAVPIFDKKPDQYLNKHANLPWIMRDSMEFLANSLINRLEHLKLNKGRSKPSNDFDMMVAFEPISSGPRRPAGTRQYDIGDFQDNFPWN